MKERSQHRDDRLGSATGPFNQAHTGPRGRRATVARWGIRIAKPRFLVYQLL